MGLVKREPRTYANVISDGTIRVKSTESDPQAVRRDYELSDGTKGTKFEQVYHELTGVITAIAFYDGEYGKTMHVTVSDNGDNIILSLSAASNYATDLMKKIPALDLSKPVTLKPYSFEDDKKKLRRGISVNQGDKKITSYFHGEKGVVLHEGYPVPDGDKKKMDTDDWKVFFINERKFLQEYIQNNIVIDPTLAALASAGVPAKAMTEPDLGVNTDDIQIDGSAFV